MKDLWVFIKGKLRRIDPLTGHIHGWGKPACVLVARDGIVLPVPLSVLQHAVPGPPLPRRKRRRHRRRDPSPEPATNQQSATRSNAKEDENTQLEDSSQSKYSREQSPSQSDMEARVLYIPRRDFEVVRRFLHYHSNVNIDRFDSEEKYRTRILHQLHPVVKLERSAVDFARQLGLCRAAPAPPAPDQHAQGVAFATASTSDVASDRSPGRRRIRRQRSEPRHHTLDPVSKMKRDAEYDSSEDQTIIAWLSASPERERAVNGNRLWRQLEDEFEQLSGKARSWQSLRARFLRYLLPTLVTRLNLSPDHAQRLRANAAIGLIKSRKTRRNSGFVALPVPSASSRAPRALPYAYVAPHTRSSPRVLRARPAGTGCSPAAATSTPLLSPTTRTSPRRRARESGAGGDAEPNSQPIAAENVHVKKRRRLYNAAVFQE